MAKIRKRGTSGAAKNYLTRSQAVRKLQISLADFRRLCIFKGIYPREPRNKKRVSKSSTPSTTFYYTKDIQYLLHEPLLNKFRDQKSLAKKISKALGRNEPNEAIRLEQNLKPRLRLDHIIKERYPTFVDALRDLDDALSMLFLFANLPSTAEVPPKVISKCQRLTREFELYLIRTHTLRKSFLSIKGIYYQATIQGQDVLWLVPYRFVQRAGPDVDFRIMATFVDFYTTLLGFVNFRLYTSIGLVYPPKLDQKSEEEGAELGAFQLEGQGQINDTNGSAFKQTEVSERAQAEADRLLSIPSSDQAASGELEYRDIVGVSSSHSAEAGAAVGEEPSTALDQFKQIDETADALDQPSMTADSSTAAMLFEPFTFFLSRETPRHSLEFLVKAFGCKRVGWDSTLGEGAYCNEDDPRVTHQVVDRPDLPLPSPPLTDGEGNYGAEVLDDDGEPIRRPQNVRVPGRTYVQPQWVWDSINAGKLQRADLYAPGATLPPHLSPWVKPKKGDYDPTKTLADQETEAEAEAAADEEEEDELEQSDEVDQGSDGEEVEGARGDQEARAMEEASAEEENSDGGMQVELADSASESEEEDRQGGDDEFGGFSDAEDSSALDDEARAVREHQAELEAEIRGGKPANADAKAMRKQKQEAKKRQVSRAEMEQAEDIERRKMMMSRRKRKMFDKMQYSNAKKDEEAEKMRSKRRKIEKESGKSARV